MKLYFVLFVALVASANAGKGGKWKEEKMAHMKECMQETGITMEEFKKAFREENPSQSVKCTTHCMARKMGVLTEDENIDINKVLEKFGKDEKKAAAIKQCEETAKGHSEKCDRTFTFQRCIMKAMGWGKGKGGKKGQEEKDDDNV